MSATKALLTAVVPKDGEDKIIVGTLAAGAAATFPVVVPAVLTVGTTTLAVDATFGIGKGLWWVLKKTAGGIRKAAENAREARERAARERQDRERQEAEVKAAPTAEQLVDAAQAEFAYWVSIWSAMPLEDEDRQARINAELDRLSTKLDLIRAGVAPLPGGSGLGS